VGDQLPEAATGRARLFRRVLCELERFLGRADREAHTAARRALRAGEVNVEDLPETAALVVDCALDPLRNVR
jgi:hypothetical protein